MFLTIKMCTCAKLFEIELIICIKMNLALNNQQRLICHKTPTNQPFPGLLHFILDTYFIILNVKQGDIKYCILSLWYDLSGY